MSTKAIDNVRTPLFWRAVAAEFIGTMFLTLIGCGSCIDVNPNDPYKPTVVQIALCFGISVATMAWCIGHVSGCNINPAATCALLVTRRISVLRALLYIVAQCLGAVAGAGILKGLTPKEVQGALGATTVNPALNDFQAVGVEFLITFVLMFTVFAAIDNDRDDHTGSVALTIGLSVTVCHLFAVEYTGSSMNSARSFGPAVVQGVWQDHWVYWVGPILGGVTAGIIYDCCFASKATLLKARSFLMTSKAPSVHINLDNVHNEKLPPPPSHISEDRIHLKSIEDNDDAA